jgi:hypothetical protein
MVPLKLQMGKFSKSLVILMASRENMNICFINKLTNDIGSGPGSTRQRAASKVSSITNLSIDGTFKQLSTI